MVKGAEPWGSDRGGSWLAREAFSFWCWQQGA